MKNSNCDCNSPNCSCNIVSIPKIDDDVKQNIKITMMSGYELDTYIDILDDIYNESDIRYLIHMDYIDSFIYIISELLLKYFDKNHVVQFYINDEKSTDEVFSFNILDIMIHSIRKLHTSSKSIFYIHLINAIKKSMKNNGILKIVAIADVVDLSSLIPINENNNIIHKIYNMVKFFKKTYSYSYDDNMSSILDLMQNIKYYCIRFNYGLPQYFENIETINERLKKTYCICADKYKNEYIDRNFTKSFSNNRNMTEFQEIEINFNKEYKPKCDYFIGGYGTSTKYGVRNETNIIHNNNENYDDENDNYENNNYDDYDEYDNDYYSDDGY